MARLLAYFADVSTGVHRKSEVIASLNLNARSFERVTAELQGASLFADEMARMGVLYHATKGRGKEAYFIKL